MNKILWMSILIILCFFLGACDPSANFNYIISNNSQAILKVIIFPDENKKIEDDPLYPGCNTYTSINYIGNSGTEIPKHQTDITLKSKESIVFTEWVVMAGVGSDPQKSGSCPLWLEHNCLRKIVIGETKDSKERVIPVEYWSNRDNWIRQNKKKRYVEYWLKIDDAVISQESALQPIN